jgi:hypothetical protein
MYYAFRQMIEFQIFIYAISLVCSIVVEAAHDGNDVTSVEMNLKKLPTQRCIVEV